MARIVIIGLSITSSWGNGHATTYRALVKALARRGHEVTFLERDVPWYASSRDLPAPPFCRTLLYRGIPQLEAIGARSVRDADAVIVGSYVPEGVAVGRWALSVATEPVVFYDIDTPVTLARLAAGEDEYLDLPLLALYDAYLSFTGGPTLRRIEEMGSPFAAALYCSVDPDIHAPVPVARRWSLGYLGTYSKDRQPTLESLLLAPTATLSDRRFVIGGPQYPADIPWPPNVDRIEHVPPAHHAAFYSAQDVTLNVTRSDMRAAGYSPSVRLFEATACGVPVVSDVWDGLDSIFRIGTEILVAEDSEAMVDILTGIPDEQRRAIGRAARAAVLARHTSAHRAAELEATLAEVGRRSRRSRPAYA